MPTGTAEGGHVHPATYVGGQVPSRRAPQGSGHKGGDWARTREFDRTCSLAASPFSGVFFGEDELCGAWPALRSSGCGRFALTFDDRERVLPRLQIRCATCPLIRLRQFVGSHETAGPLPSSGGAEAAYALARRRPRRIELRPLQFQDQRFGSPAPIERSGRSQTLSSHPPMRAFRESSESLPSAACFGDTQHRGESLAKRLIAFASTHGSTSIWRTGSADAPV